MNKVTTLVDTLEMLVHEEGAAIKRKDIEYLGTVLKRKKNILFELFENTGEGVLQQEGMPARIEHLMSRMKAHMEEAHILKDEIRTQLNSERTSVRKLKGFRDSYAA